MVGSFSVLHVAAMAWWWDTPLRTRQSFAGVEHGSRVSQIALNIHCERMRAPEHAPRDPSRVLEHRHGLADIVERSAGVPEERLRVKRPHLEREIIILPENTSGHGNRFEQQCLGFFEMT